jgi:putative Holliday junction resolvase
VKVLAVDPGEKRTGLAVSAGSIAVALPTLAMKGDGRDADRIAKVARDAEAERIIVGLPLNMDGTEGPRAKTARDFADDLRALTDLPVELWDERLSTAEGEARLREAGLDRRELSKRSDAAAAIVILESYLKAHS